MTGRKGYIERRRHKQSDEEFTKKLEKLTGVARMDFISQFMKSTPFDVAQCEKAMGEDGEQARGCVIQIETYNIHRTDMYS